MSEQQSPETPAAWYERVTGCSWESATEKQKLLAESHVRDRAARLEDAAWRDVNTVTDWEFVEIGKLMCGHMPRDLALKVIRAEGLLEFEQHRARPSPTQITDADVERCTEIHWDAYVQHMKFPPPSAWTDLTETQQKSIAVGIRAALAAFLSPPPPDPIQTAIDQAAAQVCAAGGVWTDVHERAVRKVLEGRKDG